MRVTLKAKPAIGSAITTRPWALELRGSTLPKSKKRSAPATPKLRDPGVTSPLPGQNGLNRPQKATRRRRGNGRKPIGDFAIGSN